MGVSQHEKRYIRKALLSAPQKPDPPTQGALRHAGINTETLSPLGLNESLFPPSPKVIDAIRNNVDRINFYPDAQCPDLSAIISERTGVPKQRIIWGNGSEELLKGAIDLSVSPGEGVILPVPTFWGYKAMVASFEADVTEVQNLADGHTDCDNILAAINDNTRIVFLITPNNPTGRLTSQEDLEKVVHGVPDDVLLCVDEAYFEFGQHAGGPSVLDTLKKRSGPWITVFTFSKAYAMAGMRIGYALCSDDELAHSLRKTTCVFNVPILSQYAAEAALKDTEHLGELLDWVTSGRQQLTEGLQALGLNPIPSVTNFVSCTVPMNGRECLSALLEQGVQINAWADPGYENYIRITVGRPEDNVRALGALREALPKAA